ncbi:MAG TPA: hypothetical protein VF319_08735 [Caldimonas sp.]
MLTSAVSLGWAGPTQQSFLDIRVKDMTPGTLKVFRWKGRPYVIVRTTDAMLDDLREQTLHTWSQRPVAADRPAFFVFSRLQGAPKCAVRYAPKEAPRYAPERLWQGGFYDSCRFGEWDHAGRAIRQYPDQDESMRRPDLEVPTFELRDRLTLRLAR